MPKQHETQIAKKRKRRKKKKTPHRNTGARYAFDTGLTWDEYNAKHGWPVADNATVSGD